LLELRAIKWHDASSFNVAYALCWQRITFYVGKAFAMRRTLIYATSLLCHALMACGSDTSSVAVSLNGCSAANAQTSLSISVADYVFTPACVKITAGSSLTFINRGPSAHTVTSDTGAPNTFDYTAFDPNAVLTVPFTNAGATGVHCDYHSQMKMTVIVQ
jgi:plastocyanin